MSDCSFSNSMRRAFVVGVMMPCSIAAMRFLILRCVSFSWSSKSPIPLALS